MTLKHHRPHAFGLGVVCSERANRARVRAPGKRTCRCEHSNGGQSIKAFLSKFPPNGQIDCYTGIVDFLHANQRRHSTSNECRPGARQVLYELQISTCCSNHSSCHVSGRQLIRASKCQLRLKRREITESKQKPTPNKRRERKAK